MLIRKVLHILQDVVDEADSLLVIDILADKRINQYLRIVLRHRGGPKREDRVR